MRGSRNGVILVAAVVAVAGMAGSHGVGAELDGVPLAGGLVGSASCRECHPAFHERWATSRHGASVLSVDGAWADANLAPLPAEVRSAQGVYRLEYAGEDLAVMFSGAEAGREPVRVEFALGGRGLWYFLGELDAGRLQVLPVAFDRRREVWFNPAASGVRPHAGEVEAQVEWTSPAFTFNRACYSCHVSGTGDSGAVRSATASAWWDEPGIRCESCHGPAADHVRVCLAAGSSRVPEELEIIKVRAFDREQLDGLCGSCHSRRTPLTPQFQPGDALADHYELALLEDSAFFPDGRERGETYTMTSWLANRCAQEGGLDCLHCHTSSGRDRFPGDQANQACLPCHASKVNTVEQHSHHRVGQPGSRCVDCHMPVSEFARMRRHDHSLRPPTPATTVLMGSPNACSLCHLEHDAHWADARVREWHPEDYQAPVVRRARWIERARARDWTHLEDLLASLAEEKEESVYVASMIRLLGACEDERKVPTLVENLEHSSPWVQASAAAGLEGHLSARTLPGLLRLAGHPRLLVRMRAGQALAALPSGVLEAAEQSRVDQALSDYEKMLLGRSEDPAACEALGHLRLDRGDARGAVVWFERALENDASNLGLLISSGTAHYRSGEIREAGVRFQRAVELHRGRAMAWSNWVRYLSLSGREEESKRAGDEALRVLAGEERDRYVATMAGP